MFWNITFASMCFLFGIIAFIAKKIPIRYGADLELGNSSYIISLIFFMVSAWLFLHILKEFKSEKTTHSICPKCKETYLYKDLKDGKCPTCKVDTIDIDKYYNNKSNKGNS